MDLRAQEDQHDPMTYLLDRRHWQVGPVDDLGLFFRALAHVMPDGATLCIAEGAWPRSVREHLEQVAVTPHRSSPRLPLEFRSAYHIPINMETMDFLSDLAKEHAEPEIGLHFAVYDPSETLVEWFDAASDPICLSESLHELQVQRFAQELQAEYQRLGGGV